VSVESADSESRERGSLKYRGEVILNEPSMSSTGSLKRSGRFNLVIGFKETYDNLELRQTKKGNSSRDWRQPVGFTYPLQVIINRKDERKNRAGKGREQAKDLMLHGEN